MWVSCGNDQLLAETEIAFSGTALVRNCMLDYLPLDLVLRIFYTFLLQFLYVFGEICRHATILMSK